MESFASCFFLTVNLIWSQMFRVQNDLFYNTEDNITRFQVYIPLKRTSFHVHSKKALVERVQCSVDLSKGNSFMSFYLQKILDG